ncbi:MAG TPA: Crp/Fnr family transcriptional regulator [Pyrinomonadaceae bacterium]|nr:Crp/Fnr family transcriptional regulator [Pyrinomonadaceae bacterium]
MSSSSDPPLLMRNHILRALPRQSYQLLFSNLQQVQLERDRILYDLGEPITSVFFITSGMVSLLATTENGSSTQVAMVSEEGVVGAAVVLKTDKAPYQVMVQIPGRAMRVRADVFVNEFGRDGPLRDILLRYIHCLISQISRTAACNRFHTVEQRLSCWLLIGQDKVKSEVLTLTQERLANMLGAKRTNVTKAAATLKRAGIIQYHHGRIRILNRSALEQISCECYRLVTEELGCFLAA